MTSMKVKFRASSIPGKEGVLFFSIIRHRKSRKVSTPFRLFAWEWDQKRMQVLPENSSRPELLKQLQQKIHAESRMIGRIIEHLEKPGLPYSVDDIVDTYKNRLHFGSLFSFINRQHDILKAAGQYKTANAYLCALRSFRTFRNGRDIEIVQIDSRLVKDYETWLKMRGLTLNSISYYMRILRAVYNKAAIQGLTPSQHPFNQVYTGIEKTRKRAVGENIISKLRQAGLPQGPVARARDLFLFSFYTRGMSFIDMAYLRKENIRNGAIVYKRRKTGQTLRVGLEKCILDIIRRYQTETSDSPYVLPIIDQNNPRPEDVQYENALRYQNKLLKRLSAETGLPGTLTSYVARHSWATIAKKRNIPISVISEGMGHTSEVTTRIYLNSLDQSVLDKANRIILTGIK